MIMMGLFILGLFALGAVAVAVLLDSVGYRVPCESTLARVGGTLQRGRDPRTLTDAELRALLARLDGGR